MAMSYSIVYICHIFFTHLSINRHLGCFPILTIVNNVAIKIRVHMSFHILWTRYPEVELLGHMVVWFLSFWGISILFSIVAAPIYSLTNSVQVFSFLHYLKNICFSCPIQYLLFLVFLKITILIGVKWHLTGVLICISLIISDIEHLFMCLWTSVYLLWKKVYSNPLPIFFSFYGFSCSIWKFPCQGSNQSSRSRPTPQPHWIQAASATYTTVCGNARSLAHWSSPGIKPSSSQREHQVLNLLSHSGNSLPIFKSRFFFFLAVAELYKFIINFGH